MQLQSAMKRFSLLGSVAMLLAAGIVGCVSPVDSPDGGSTSMMLKAGGKATITGGKKPSKTTIVAETEPNDDPALTTDVITFAQPGRTGTIASATDNDYFLTPTILPGQKFIVQLNMPFGFDYDVQILANDGVTVIATDIMASGSIELHSMTNSALVGQSYILRVFSANGSYSTVSPYSVMIGVS